MQLEIYDKCLVCLIGSSGSGKTTFGRKHFRPTEVLSSDYFRALVSDDENNQSVTPEAFYCLHQVAEARLKGGRLTVIDATSLRSEDRAGLIKLAKNHDLFSVAIVLNPGLTVCQARNSQRPERASMPARVLIRHDQLLQQSLGYLSKEGFRQVYVLKGEEAINQAEVVRVPLYNNLSSEEGPFDIIGDVHGCFDELVELLEKLGYQVNRDMFLAKSSEGRKAIFLGDLVDRGPDTVKVLKLVMNMTEQGQALCVPGNHDLKLQRYLSGKHVRETKILRQTVTDLQNESEEFRKKVTIFLGSLISHYLLDHGNLVVAHAGLPERYQGRSSARVRDFCLFGETTGEYDSYGLPVRLDWTNDYHGRALVVYGHIPRTEVAKQNNTIGLDTSCVFGGYLSAWRYPEGKIVQVKAHKVYFEPIKHIGTTEPDAVGSATDGFPMESSDLIRIEKLIGKQFITTEIEGEIKIPAERMAAALELVGRFSVNTGWLIYLPPTMSPCETSSLEDYLEYPTEALDYYASKGISKVICQTKHMGSRAVVVLTKEPRVAVRRFKVTDGSRGAVYTRAGRSFFNDQKLESGLLERLSTALSATGFWDRFQTDWTVLDCELLPWSAKAQSLIASHYGSVGWSGLDGLLAAKEVLSLAGERADLPSETRDQLRDMSQRMEQRRSCIQKYVEALGRYCWPVDGLEGIRLAPFQILAVEGRVLADMDHGEHLRLLAEHLSTDPIFLATKHVIVETSDPDSLKRAEDFWLEMTLNGGEGMVVKPFRGLNDRLPKNGHLPQPAIKCRGREYLRIIYGPEYLYGDNLMKLKERKLGQKRSLAIKEYALGLEALTRFTAYSSPEMIHQCVLAIMAMENEPTDPRL
jgi:protein phosphatase